MTNPSVHNAPGAPAVLLGRLNENDIGQMIDEQEAVLLAPAFQYSDPHGVKIGPPLNYFVAPQDSCFLQKQALGDYDDHILEIAGLNHAKGERRIVFVTEDAVLDAAAHDPAALALWHMPPLVLLCGHRIGQGFSNPDNMFAHRYKGVLKGTFAEVGFANLKRAHWYWSCRESQTHSGNMFSLDMRTGDMSWGSKHGQGISSRPVKAEICAPC